MAQPVDSKGEDSVEPKASQKEGSSIDDVRRRFSQEIRRVPPSPAAGSGGRGGEVLLCSGNPSFKRSSSSTRSRLVDLPVRVDRRSGRSAVLSGKVAVEDEFADDDIPDEFKKIRFSRLTLVQLVSLVLIIGALICNLSVPILKKQTLWDLPLWKWELMLFVIICGRLCSGWGIRVAVFFIERNFLLRKRVLYFVYGLRKAVQNCLWLGLVLIVWDSLFDDKVEKEIDSPILPFITKILVCLLVGSAIWLLKTIAIKVLALSFHVNAFFERIQESLFNQYVIETLSMPPIFERGCFQEGAERGLDEAQKKPQKSGSTTPVDLESSPLVPKSGRVLESGLQKSPRIGKSPRFSTASTNAEDEEITLDHLHKLNQDNISAWNMKRLMNIVAHGSLHTLDECILNSHTEDESSSEIRSEAQARKAARKIFHNVAKMGCQYIYLEDLMCFMREDEALKTMRLFDGTTEGKRISKSSLKDWMVNAFRERRAIALSLKDTNTAVDELQHLLNVVVGIIIVVVGLHILGINVQHSLAFFASELLLLKFVFGGTCKTLFEAIIFLFVMHPFDVGDRCEVDGIQMVVEEMKMLSTVFLRYDNQKISYPNSFLASTPISNYYRSPDMADAIEFCIHVATPVDKIAAMKDRIKRCIQSNNEHWYPDPMIIMKDVVELNSLNMAVWPTHRMNYQNIEERWFRRALLVEEMVKVFKELDIEFRLLPLDVNVRQIPNSASHRLPSNWTT